MRFYAEHQTTGGVGLIQIIYSDSVDAVREFRVTKGGTWPLIDDPDGPISIDYGVTGIPETFVIGPDRIIRGKIVGKITAARLDAMLATFARGEH